MNRKLLDDMKMIMKGLSRIAEASPFYIPCMCLYAMFQSIHPFIGIYFSARITDAIFTGADEKGLIVLAGMLTTLECLCAIIMKRLNGYRACEADRLYGYFRLQINEKMFRMSYEKVEDTETHKKKAKIENADQMMERGIYRISDSFPIMLRAGFTVFFSVSLTAKLFFATRRGEGGWQGFVCSPYFSLLLLGIVLLGVWLNMHSISSESDEMYGFLSGSEDNRNLLNYYINNYIGNYHIGKDIRIYGQKEAILKEFETGYGKLDIVYKKVAAKRSFYSSIGSLTSVFISTLVCLFIGIKAMAGIFGLGSIVQYIGSINQFVNGFTEFMAEIASLRSNNEAVGYYFEYMNIPDEEEHKGIQPEKGKMVLEFHDVSFRYPSSDTYVLQHISLKITDGEKLAIVGTNGSGKTTLIKLLCRLYKPTEGYITLNGIPIEKYEYTDYMKLVAAVFQDFKLFSYPLGENIAADNVIDEKKAEDALEKAGFAERYRTLKEGLSTYLYKDNEENGVDISGGEAQKIAIARALYKDAPIVVMDEPTAALDPVSEFEIYSRFRDMVEGKTAIFISHRLSSCRFCDRIAVMERGELVQLGSHEELLKDVKGKYRNLWNAQAKYYQG